MKSLIIWLFYSIILTLVVEAIKFKSPKKAFYFMKDSPLKFILNVLIISSTLALSFLGTRKIFLFIIITFFWLFLSITNTIVTTLRGYPLMFSDIFLIKEGLSLSSHYFTPMVIIGILISLLFFLWIAYDLFQIKFETSSVQYLIGTLYVFLSGYIFYQTEKKYCQKQTEDNDFYDRMGFAYSIADSIYPYLNRKPEQYNEAIMKSLANQILPYFKQPKHEGGENVIVIQLESFFDPLTLKNLSINMDPLPTLRKLMQHEPSGQLIVPTFGGGTGKTEFEVLTSMSMNYFGPGEIPHNSILKSTPIESLATHFSSVGYETIAIHNYEGSFYNRHIAYQHLGFDRFVPLEYMTGIQVDHDLSQMNDQHLIDNILQAITEFPRCFIYAISAGMHQPYEETTYDTSAKIQISGDLSPEEKASLQDYCIRLHRLDQQIQRLLNYLEEYQIPSTLIFFSDHLPNLPVINKEKFYPYPHYQVPFIIKSSNPINFKQPVIYSYQFGSLILDMLSIKGGIMNALHEHFKEQDNYQLALKLTQYDLLYGKAILPSFFPPQPIKELKFGIKPIIIKTVIQENDYLKVIGSGFNGDSQIYIDGKKVLTQYISEHELQTELKVMKGELLTIKQISGYHQPLGKGISYPLELTQNQK